jgi:hypothetical protein
MEAGHSERDVDTTYITKPMRTRGIHQDPIESHHRKVELLSTLDGSQHTRPDFIGVILNTGSTAA